MEDIFVHLLTMSITGAVVILAVLLARLLLRRAPRWLICLLWLPVLLRLLCPAALQLPTSALPRALESEALAERWMENGTAQASPAVFPGGFSPSFSPLEENPLAEKPLPLDFFIVVEPEAEGTAAGGFLWVPFLGWLWLGGAAVMLIWGAARWLLLRRRLQTAARVEENVWEADGIPSPFVLGLLRPRVYLPSALPESARHYVLLHEKAHLRRLDHVWKLLGWLTLCLHWFNPLCWLAFSLAVGDMELACDEAVLKDIGTEERQHYSRLILELSEGRPLLSPTPLGFGEGSVKQRIRNALRWKKPKWWMLVLGAVILAAVVLFFAFDPVKTAAPEETDGQPGIVETAAPDLAATPTPEPTDGTQPYQVTPGWTALTREEIDAAREGLAPLYFREVDGITRVYASSVDPCFTSYYDDPRELNLNAFLKYYGEDLEPASEEDFRMLRGAGYFSGSPWLRVEDYPVPIRRIPAAEVEDTLQYYYGIGLRDLKTDYRSCFRYLGATDCFYSITSDFGPGTFQPDWGEKQGNRVRLWSGFSCLSLEEIEGHWYIRSFTNETVAERQEEPSETWNPPQNRTLSPEYLYAFAVSEAEITYEDANGLHTATIPALERVAVTSELLDENGILWLHVRREALKAPPAMEGWVLADDLAPWGEAWAEIIRAPVYLPAGSVYYPCNFGDYAGDSLEDCLREENAMTHGYDVTGAILEEQGEYARVGISGGLEFWVLRTSLHPGTPQDKETQMPSNTRLLYLARGMASTLGILEDWGAETVYHSADGGYISAYFPLRDSTDTACVVFSFSEAEGWVPSRAVLIPEGAEDWP